jgi:hypothetical protein
MAGHQRTADTPAGGGRADTPAGGGQAGAVLRMGMHAHAMGEGRIRREPQRGGRVDVSTTEYRQVVVVASELCCTAWINNKTLGAEILA